MYKEKLKKKKKQWTCRCEKMGKAVEENKLTVMLKRLMRIQFILEIYVYRQK